MTLNADRHPLHRGRVFVLRPRSRCRASHDSRDPLTVSYVHFHVLNTRGSLMHGPARGLPPVTKSIASPDLFERVCRRIDRLDSLPGGRAEACAYLSALLIGLRAEPDVTTASKSPRGAVLEAARLAREQPARFHTAADLADVAGYGIDHLTDLFKRHVGLPPGQFLIDTRLRRAETLLSHSDTPVAAVARELGYTSAAYFSRQFKQSRGMSPARFREAAARSGRYG